jgi:hypothetical protein
MQTSRDEHECVTADDCAVVTGPGHPDPQYAEVVHRGDAAALDARANAHLESCGAFHYIGTYDVQVTITALCTASHCAPSESTMHFDPITK